MDDNVSQRQHDQKVSSVNLPNALTVLRLILVPVFIVLALQTEAAPRWWAVVVFMVAAATDQLDGHIARSRNLVTDFGRIADPIADKALTLSAFAVLSLAEILPWWVTILIAVRELGITALRAVLLRRDIVVSANKGGKLKTVLQILGIWLLLIPWDVIAQRYDAAAPIAHGFYIAGLVVVGLALVVTLWSGWVYVSEGVRLWRAPNEQS